MNDSQRRHYERLVRGFDYGTLRNADFPAGSKGGKALANLGGLITQIEEKDAAIFTNLGVTQQGTDRRKESRLAVRAQVLAISVAAETIGLDHPEVKSKFRRPYSNVGDQTLIGVARSFIAEATPLKALFLEYDMPADFIDRLKESVDDFEQAITQQNTGGSERRANKVALETLIKQAEVELERLNTAVRIKYRDDQAAMAAWESARRLERPPKSKKGGPAAPPA